VLACHTQEEIANALVPTVTKETVSEIVGICQKKFSETKSDKSAAEHATDFDPPIYNVWKQQKKTNNGDHFGNSEITWLDNLLYLYTQPFDIVIDPFAGGGSTIDLCRQRFRRYYVGDRLPIIEREKEIRKHDLVTDGLPKPPNWTAQHWPGATLRFLILATARPFANPSGVMPLPIPRMRHKLPKRKRVDRS